jgi:hypothetical protein
MTFLPGAGLMTRPTVCANSRVAHRWVQTNAKSGTGEDDDVPGVVAEDTYGNEQGGAQLVDMQRFVRMER